MRCSLSPGSVRLPKKTVFRWKRHVASGEIALGALLAGVLGGMTVVKVYWHGFLITGTHGKVALALIPFVIFGLVSGLYMNRKKKQQRLLSFIHGLNNLIVLILALTQVVSGWWVYRTFVTGG
jgi:nitric oxide reductase large subunit